MAEPTREAREEPLRLCVMLSGGGRTLGNLLSHMDDGRVRAQVVLVIASRECAGADAARRRGIRTLVIGGEIGREELGRLLDAARADLVVLAGYLRRVRIPAGFERRVVNIHPALLPEFGGHGMYGMRVHEAVLAAGRRETGCSVHLCDAEYDHGPVILQKRCPVLPGDTPESLAARVFALECEAYPEAIRMIVEGRVQVADGQVRVVAPRPGCGSAWRAR
jgi:phosphoribosylglycinamide formyltransferase-1